jgi:hypothetical protein
MLIGERRKSRHAAAVEDEILLDMRVKFPDLKVCMRGT